MYADKLASTTAQLRAILSRNDGDIYHIGPALLDRIDVEIERLRGFEAVACIDTEKNQEAAHA